MDKNLSNEEALKKYKELVNEIKVCMFITDSPDKNHTRPMYTVETEDNGTLWFFTNKNSIKVDEVNSNHNVHLVYAHPGKESYLDIWGTATITTDQQTIKDKWTPMMKAWFPKGVDDPDVALLRVEPNDCYYWDAEAGKMISFLKIVAGAITGRPSIGSDAKGSLNI
jgi:general stress protein 26